MADMDYYENADIEQISKFIHGTKKGLFFGFGAISKFGEILDDLKPSCVGFVTSKGAYKHSGMWEQILKMLEARKIQYLHYDKVAANPTIEVVDECVQMFKPKYDKHFVVVTIGGGSPGDAGKAVSVLLEHSDKTARQLMKLEFTPERRSLLVNINITHGTGTECDQFAVVSILHGEKHPYKPCLANPVIYPDYAIDDVNAMFSMSDDMTRFVSIDALNHVMEAATTRIATPYSRTMAKEVCYIENRYLPEVLKNPKDRRGRYWLTYAAAIAGMAFDESLLHATHALEHTLSAYMPTLAHGHGLALIQPAIVRLIWPASEKVLQPLFEPIFGKEKLTPQQAFDKMRAFHNKCGFNGTAADAGFKKSMIDEMVQATEECPGMKGLLALTPVECGPKEIKEVYEASFFDKK